MFEVLREHPGRLYVAAAILPLLPATLILAAAAAKNLARPAASAGGFAGWAFQRLGGDRPQTWPAYLTVGCFFLATVQGIGGLLPFVSLEWSERELGHVIPHSVPDLPWPPGAAEAYNGATLFSGGEDPIKQVWLAENADWIRVGSQPDVHRSSVLTVGYFVDLFVAVLFAVVTVISTAVAVFSIGYMGDERGATVDDHGAHAARRGRFGLYFAYLSMFVSAMLNLLIADNLLQVFVCWELVGVCSFLLVGFYFERPAAATAATKAFVVNRIGDAGFLVALALAWTWAGTLDIRELTYAMGDGRFETAADLHEFWSGMDYWVLTAIGFGLFMACVGKSAQVPLHVWLPDAMAGPTPVSALIHAATMVAAGVYLCVRCRGMFVPSVQVAIAYTGCITMLLGATAACAQTDIKRVLAYSTVSQLGLMMLAFGVGSNGPQAAALHLITHAFFKALLFLAAGAVIHALRHEQDVRRMGGLFRRMPVTGSTMLIGVLAISGFPLTSGWYSKGEILTDAVVAGMTRPGHVFLAAAAFLTAGLTSYYMLRLWLRVFAGEARDPGTVDYARDPGALMLVPLCALAAFSLTLCWFRQGWDSEISGLSWLLRRLLYTNVEHSWLGIHDASGETVVYATHDQIREWHFLIEVCAGLIMLAGFAVAVIQHVRRISESTRPPRFCASAWGFDAAYRSLIVRPVRWLASMTAAADKRPGTADGTGSDPAARRFDPGTLDGWLNAVGLSALTAGGAVRRVQAGFLRGYVLALGLTVVGLLGMLAALLP